MKALPACRNFIGNGTVCIMAMHGCTNTSSLNFNRSANVDD
eukprot:SAG31_NODE_30851_length_375_cov_0.938406_1_plen_40_part_10